MKLKYDIYVITKGLYCRLFYFFSLVKLLVYLLKVSEELLCILDLVMQFVYIRPNFKLDFFSLISRYLLMQHKLCTNTGLMIFVFCCFYVEKVLLKIFANN